jgi:hypothetical protein
LLCGPFSPASLFCVEFYPIAKVNGTQDMMECAELDEGARLSGLGRQTPSVREKPPAKFR